MKKRQTKKASIIENLLNLLSDSLVDLSQVENHLESNIIQRGSRGYHILIKADDRPIYESGKGVGFFLYDLYVPLSRIYLPDIKKYLRLKFEGEVVSSAQPLSQRELEEISCTTNIGSIADVIYMLDYGNLEIYQGKEDFKTEYPDPRKEEKVLTLKSGRIVVFVDDEDADELIFTMSEKEILDHALQNVNDILHMINVSSQVEEYQKQRTFLENKINSLTK